jgi:hypothetical protein
MTQPPQYPHGQQPYGSPYQQPYGSPYQRHQPPPSQAMAGWALALTILSCIPLAIFVGSGLAIAVLVRSKEGRNYGTGKAIASLIIAGVWLLAGVALFVTGMVQGLQEGTDAHRDDQGQVTERTDISVQNLREGDCFDDEALLGASEDTTNAVTAQVMPCAEEHHFEIFHVFELSGDSYPGDATVSRLANDGCFSAFDAFVGKPPERSTLQVYFYVPQKRTWSILGDRTVQCAIASPEGLVTGTLENSRL